MVGEADGSYDCIQFGGLTSKPREGLTFFVRNGLRREIHAMPLLDRFPFGVKSKVITDWRWRRLFFSSRVAIYHRCFHALFVRRESSQQYPGARI